MQTMKGLSKFSTCLLSISWISSKKVQNPDSSGSLGMFIGCIFQSVGQLIHAVNFLNPSMLCMLCHLLLLTDILVTSMQNKPAKSSFEIDYLRRQVLVTL